jgi:multidrug efflux pump
LGGTNITMQFDLSRSIDAAARDVQAAINAARSDLPANLPNNPSYRKVNPADSPVLMLALTSKLIPRERMYDIASSVLQQKLSQVKGVGQVFVWGVALPAVRVDVNPVALNSNDALPICRWRTSASPSAPPTSIGPLAISPPRLRPGPSTPPTSS